jgi:hypothetical protein
MSPAESSGGSGMAQISTDKALVFNPQISPIIAD